MIAPKLQSSLREIVKGVPLFSTIHGEEATRELRALLAVARAALAADAVRYKDSAETVRLKRAVEALRRASAAAGKGAGK